MDFLTDLFSLLSIRDSLLVLLFLFVAFLIGLIVGWLYWRRRLEELRTELTQATHALSLLQKEMGDVKIKLANTEEDLHRANMDADNFRKKFHTCEEEKGQLRADIYTLQEKVDGKDDAPAKGGVADAAKLALSAAMGSRITKADVSEKDDLKLINGVGPFIEKKLNALGLYTYQQISQFDDELVDQVTDAIEFFPGRIARDNWVGQAAALYQTKQTNPEALKKPKATPSNPNDLKVIEGVGPKIEELLNKGGITNWSELAGAPVAKLQEILDAAGDRYRIHDPGTWPKQAELLASGDFAGFKEYTDFLQGGKTPG